MQPILAALISFEGTVQKIVNENRNRVEVRVGGQVKSS